MGKYDDIIDLPHHVSGGHPHMSMAQRAAQFAPFAALTGYEKSIEDVLKREQEKVEHKLALDKDIKSLS